MYTCTSVSWRPEEDHADLRVNPKEAAAMSSKSGPSKALALAFAILTVAVIAGTITMAIFYVTELEELKPTPRPTLGTTTTGPPPVMRLPKNLLPERYSVNLQLFFRTRISEDVNGTGPEQSLRFSGNSTVRFRCTQGTGAIYLHAKGLVLGERLRVLNVDTGERVGGNWTLHEDEREFLEIQLEENLVAGGNYSLFTEFEGTMSDNLEALYLSTYVEGNAGDEGDANAER